MAKPFKFLTITAWITSVTPWNRSNTPNTIIDAMVAAITAVRATNPTTTDTSPKTKKTHHWRAKVACSWCWYSAEEAEVSTLMRVVLSRSDWDLKISPKDVRWIALEIGARVRHNRS